MNQTNMNQTTRKYDEGRTSPTDVSNLGDYDTMTVKTTGGKEIKLRLYGR